MPNKMHGQKITAIVLAAGLGSRFGGDKLLTPIQHPDKTNSKQPLGLISALNVQPHVDEVICIIKPNDQALKTLFESKGLKTICNANYETGLSSSIKAGIKACEDSQNHHYMICLADMPYIQAMTYKKIIEAFNCIQTITRPMFITETGINKSGHPVIFPHKYRNELLNLTGDEGGKPLIKRYDVNQVITSDSGIIMDIDVKQDIKD